MTTTAKLTFAELVRLEPRLGELLAVAKAQRRKRGFCANRVWYPTIKPTLVRLVGWHSGRERGDVLRSQQAYDLAYETIYEALPNCNHPSSFFCL